MDLRQLKYFVQIVESGSLAKASRQLYIAQPALSQHIAKLEAEVGKPLLIRTAKGVTPTENGAALHHHARFILRQLDQALSIARQEPGTVHGMVSVGLAATTVCAVGAPFTSGYTVVETITAPSVCASSLKFFTRSRPPQPDPANDSEFSIARKKRTLRVSVGHL